MIPQEAGLNERAVSFTKGCYVGQETVARLFYRGKPNRHLRGLRLSEPVAAGHRAAARREGGRARSARSSSRRVHGPIALALVRREAEPGATLAAGDGDATAEVVELPFAASRDSIARSCDGSTVGRPFAKEPPMAAHVLVLANVTASSGDLIDALSGSAPRRARST